METILEELPEEFTSVHITLHSNGEPPDVKNAINCLSAYQEDIHNSWKIASLIPFLTSHNDIPQWAKEKFKHLSILELDQITFQDIRSAVEEDPFIGVTNYEGVETPQPISKLRSAIHQNPLEIDILVYAVPIVSTIFSLIAATRKALKTYSEYKKDQQLIAIMRQLSDKLSKVTSIDDAVKLQPIILEIAKAASDQSKGRDKVDVIPQSTK